MLRSSVRQVIRLNRFGCCPDLCGESKLKANHLNTRNKDLGNISPNVFLVFCVQKPVNISKTNKKNSIVGRVM